MGGWGRDWAWRIIPGVEAVDLVGCCDSDPAALKLARKEARIPAQRCFAGLEEPQRFHAKALRATSIAASSGGPGSMRFSIPSRPAIIIAAKAR